ncbi:MAG: glycosyltransferase [Bacteroidales bacterium]|nr:glycosyltransferase [Bacteroidales bacterium]
MNKLLVLTTRYIHNYDFVGATYIYDQVEQLRHHFKEVVVIAYRPLIPQWLLPLLPYKRRRDFLARDYEYENVKVVFCRNFIVPLPFIKRNWSIRGYKKTIKILNEISFHPEIIHVHRTWPTGEIAFYLSKYYKIQYVLTAHGYDAYGLPSKNRYYKQTIEKILLSAKKVISVSKANIKKMQDIMDIPNYLFEFIPNGFDSTLFQMNSRRDSRHKLGIPYRSKVFLSVGFLYKVKGYDFLIKAIKILVEKKRYSDIILYIVGDGQEYGKLINLIDKLDLKNHVILVGSVKHEEIPIWMNSSDYFVMSSLIEGMPTVMFEALSCGKPFIGTNVGGIPEIIVDSKLGTLVPPKNTEKLAVALEKALQTKWNSKYISSLAQKHSWQNICKKILEIYK